MKRILITGAGSYVGTSFEHYATNKYPEKYLIDTLDMKDDNWKNYDFSLYDVVFHVAGIAHVDDGKCNSEQNSLYYKINTELAIETAKKAKSNGVKQFIFMSSAIVYGNSASVGQQKIITKKTAIKPASTYGESKVQAEAGIIPLQDYNFNIAILRPPMIYGKECNGNYNILSKIAKKTLFFPYVQNQRSMLYIGNLCEFVRLIIDNYDHGIFWPQNSQYSNTSEIVKTIASVNNKKVFLIKGFSWCIKLISSFSNLTNKAFGNMIYDKELSKYKNDYCIYELEESIKITEGLKDV